MSPAKIGMIILFGWIAIILGGLTYLIFKKKDATLISGFSNRPKEEQEQLKKSGFIEALGKLLLTSFIIYMVTYILWIFSVPYSLEVGFSIFILVLFIGMIWMQRYEVSHKRKKMYWITSVISLATFAFIGVLLFFGWQENEVTIENEMFIVTGMYGFEWELSNIESVELLDELPHVMMRTNGFATEGTMKGRFRLEEPYGGGLLFVRTKDGPPYLYIKTDEDYVILNREEADETKALYDTLSTVLRSP